MAMNITKTDYKILLITLTFVIFMTTMFPAMGLGAEDDEFQYNDIPNLTTSTDVFDFAGEMPEPPTILPDERDAWIETGPILITQHHLVEERLVVNLDWKENDNEIEIKAFTYGDYPTSDFEETIVIDDDIGNTGTLIIEDIHGETANPNWTIQFRIMEIGPDPDAEHTEDRIWLRYQFLEQPEFDEAQSKSIFNRVVTNTIGGMVPVVGPIIAPLVSAGLGVVEGAAGGSVGAVMFIFEAFVWLNQTLLWFLTFLFQWILTFLVILVDVTVFLLSLGWFIINTQIAVMAALPSVIALFYGIPTIALYLVMGKFILVGISVLPFT